MGLLHRLTESIRSKSAAMRENLTDDEMRKRATFVLFDLALGAVALWMTIVNLLTSMWILAAVTGGFALLCVVNVHLIKCGGAWEKFALIAFLSTAMLACLYFCISGNPEGFSAMWTCMIPAFAMVLLGRGRGSILSGVGFLLIVLIFWTPFGRAALQYPYTETFKMRFPLMYVAYYLVAFFAETLRAETHNRLVKLEEHYRNLSKQDSTTGLLNRYGFEEVFEKAGADPERGKMALMLLDIDHFKEINDTYGHDNGDMVLNRTALILRKHAGDNAVCARWGGDEFAILQWQSEHALESADRIRHEIERLRIVTFNGRELRITVSIGVCTVQTQQDVSLKALMRKADECLYRAKDRGRNCVCAEEM